MQHDCAPQSGLLCTIRSGDTVLLQLDDGPAHCVVGSVSEGLVELKVHSDARAATEIRKAGRDGGRLQFTERGFKERFIGKLAVDALGRSVTAND